MNVLHTLAENYTICNNWFSSIPTDTFSNRDYMVSGTSAGQLDNYPINIFGGLKCSTTIFHRLEEKKLTWNIYYANTLGTLNNLKMLNINKLSKCYDINKLIEHINNEELPDYSYVQLTDAQSLVSNLVPYSGGTEQYIANVYNALPKSKYWCNSLIIIIYDENGGFYDSVIPPNVCQPDNINGYYWPSSDLEGNKTFINKFNFTKLGVRVPALLISPLISKGIDSNIYDYTSVLTFLEYLFNLQPLTERDKNANWKFPFLSTMREINTLPQNLKSNYQIVNYESSFINKIGSFLSNILVNTARGSCSYY